MHFLSVPLYSILFEGKTHLLHMKMHSNLIEFHLMFSSSSSSFSIRKPNTTFVVCKTCFHCSIGKEKEIKINTQKWWNARMIIEYGYIEIQSEKKTLFALKCVLHYLVNEKKINNNTTTIAVECRQLQKLRAGK